MVEIQLQVRKLNHRKLGDNLATTDIVPHIRRFIEYVSSELSDTQILEAEGGLYNIVGPLIFQDGSDKLCEALCKAMIPECMARQIHKLHGQHRQDKVSVRNTSSKGGDYYTSRVWREGGIFGKILLFHM